MRALWIVALALCLTACASATRSEWPAQTRVGAEFEVAWMERAHGDEYVRVGSYDASIDAWGVISIVRQPNETWLVRRTELDRDGRRVTIARSATCDTLVDTIEELQNVTLPTMRELEINRPFAVMSHPPDVRLRVHTYFENDDRPVFLTAIEMRSTFGSPLFWWHGSLLNSAANCWQQEGSQ